MAKCPNLQDNSPPLKCGKRNVFGKDSKEFLRKDPVPLSITVTARPKACTAFVFSIADVIGSSLSRDRLSMCG